MLVVSDPLMIAAVRQQAASCPYNTNAVGLYNNKDTCMVAVVQRETSGICNP